MHFSHSRAPRARSRTRPRIAPSRAAATVSSRPSRILRNLPHAVVARLRARRPRARAREIVSRTCPHSNGSSYLGARTAAASSDRTSTCTKPNKLGPVTSSAARARLRRPRLLLDNTSDEPETASRERALDSGIGPERRGVRSRRRSGRFGFGTRRRRSTARVAVMISRLARAD